MRIDAKIQRAVAGIQIPILLIPKLYSELTKLAKGGADVETMATYTREFVAANTHPPEKPNA